MNALWHSQHLTAWLIAGSALFGVVFRPWQVPEAVWAALGAGAMIAASLISPMDAMGAVRDGTDVYLFLAGMMLLAELARREGLFEWTAALAVKGARGSAQRLFLLIYAVGIVVTVLLSNDATAVVLTPAVYAAAKRAGAPPLPYLFVCAFIANAASFVLPISNPANLVVYGSAMPPLGRWFAQFAAPSAAAILLTYVLLRLLQRTQLIAPITARIEVPALKPGGRVAAAAIGATVGLLAASSASGRPLGLPTFIAGACAWIAILAIHRTPPWAALKAISWSVLPLVAALFILVRAIENTGALAPLAQLLRPPPGAPLATLSVGAAGVAAAFGSNLINNLPMGLIAAHLVAATHASPRTAGALLIGVDLGPNLSVAGSLATILWLLALRREGVAMSGWRFLMLGCVVMPLSLAAALGCFLAR